MKSDEIDLTINPSVDTDEIDEDGCLVFEGDVEQDVINENISKMLLSNCRLALQKETELAAEIHDKAVKSEQNKPKFDLKIFVPSVNAYKYKSQVVSELATRGRVSTDRLIHVQANTMPEEVQPTSVTEKLTVGLFDYIAIKTDADDDFYIANIKRMYRTYSTSGGRRRKMEYIRPFNISTSNVDVSFKVMLLECLTELELKGTDI